MTLPFSAYFALSLAFLPPVAAAQSQELGVFLDKHCAKCHGADDPEGGLDLVALLGAGLEENSADWLLVAEELSLRVMPPHPEPKPSDAEYSAQLTALRTALGNEVPVLWNPPVSPHGSPLRRRTAREIAGAIRALTGVNTDPSELPAEIGLHTFDVVSSGLSLDQVWLDRWLSLVDSIARRAIHEKGPQPATPSITAGADLQSRSGNAGRLNTVGTAYVLHNFPRDGEYEISATAWAQQAGPDLARVTLVLGSKKLHQEEIQGEGPGASLTMKTRVQVSQGTRKVGLGFLNDFYNPEAPMREDRDRNVIVTRVTIEGPLDALPPSALQEELTNGIESEDPESLRPALTTLAKRAWQEPPTHADITRLVEILSRESTLEAKLQLGLAAILASPRFLLVGETGDPGETLSSPALATRLALLIWGSVPDEQLQRLAAEGRLQDAETLSQEVDRMLSDPRSMGLAEGFVPQWLQIQRLATHEPSKKLFPKYNDRLRTAMLAEPVRLFHTILNEGLPARDLVRADWTHIDKHLARHYGLPTIGKPKGIARYSLVDTPRRGVLGQGAVLTASSDPGRTSPVLRGKWILEALLGDAPPPPDANTLALDQSAPHDLGLSMRERLELHRSQPGCAACHVAMDPLGFALERFNAVGRILSGPVDDQGTLPDGTKLDGPLGLTRVLETDTRFLPHLVRSLTTYALGRLPSKPELRVLEESVVKNGGEDPPLRLLVRTIALSDSFRRQPLAPSPEDR